MTDGRPYIDLSADFLFDASVGSYDLDVLLSSDIAVRLSYASAVVADLIMI